MKRNNNYRNNSLRKLLEIYAYEVGRENKQLIEH